MSRLVWFTNFVVALALSGCYCVPVDVTGSISVLRENTLKLSAHYEALLDQSGPTASTAPQTDREKAIRKAWEDHVAHEKALMKANNTLADRVHEWATVETCKSTAQGDDS